MNELLNVNKTVDMAGNICFLSTFSMNVLIIIVDGVYMSLRKEAFLVSIRETLSTGQLGMQRDVNCE